MKQKFVIDNVPITLNLTFMQLENSLIDVTCFEDAWHQYMASGVRFIELEGTTEDGQKIANKFQVINPSCYLPKEVDAAGEHKKCDFDFKTFGGDSMNGFG